RNVTGVQTCALPICHPETEIFSYDPSYEHAEARLSADEKTVMLFSYQGFRLYRIEGEQICEVEIPDAEEVYDQQFVREGAESHRSEERRVGKEGRTR